MLKAELGQLEKYYDAVLRDINYAPYYYENGFDFEEDPVLTVERPKELLPYAWGLVPWWTKSAGDLAKLRPQTLNCISEEMYEKPAFRDSAKDGKRCLIPCTGFFEWHWDNPVKAKNKTPFVMTRPDEGLFSIGGLYSSWKDKTTGREMLTYTVLTTASNKAMSYIHNSKKRMPVIIPREYEKDWLNPNLTEKDVLALCKSMPEDYLTYYSISKKISGNKLTSDEKNTPDILKKVEYTQEEIDGVVTEEPASKPKKSKPDQGQQSLF
jgi:putative SOS response-associated peptidase YedK